IWNPSLLLILVSAAPRSSHACIEHAVDQLPVLEGAFPEHAFPDKSRLLQHAHGSRIPFEYRRFQALHVEALENVVRAGANRRGHDPATPAALGEPVAEARRFYVHALAAVEADAAHRFSLDRDGPLRSLRHLLEQ